MKELSGTKHRAVDLDPLKCNDQQSKEAEKVFWRGSQKGQGSLIRRQHCRPLSVIWLPNMWLPSSPPSICWGQQVEHWTVKGKTWESCLSRRLVFSSPQIVISAFILDSFLLLISLPSVVLLHRICSRPSLTVFNISSQEFHCQVFLWLLSGHTHTCNVWITHSLGAASAKGHFL